MTLTSWVKLEPAVQQSSLSAAIPSIQGHTHGMDVSPEACNRCVCPPSAGKATATAAAVRTRRRFAGLLFLLLVLAVAILKRDSMQLLAPTIYRGSGGSKNSSSRSSRAHCRPE